MIALTKSGVTAHCFFVAAGAEFELAHVLFMDVVGYSQMLIDDQREVLRDLNEMVRSTEQFRQAEAHHKLVCLPTGDGMVIAFFTAPDAAARCAIEIARGLREQPRIKLRMGIHCGPVSAVKDVNGRVNVAGGGINMAQRVMDCGDTGHILLSQRVAEDLAEFREWNASVHDVGETEVKHGTKLHLFNFFGENFGNPAVPSRLGRGRVKASGSRRPVVVPILAGFLLVAVITGLVVFLSRLGRRSEGSAAVTEKSIAVLPFENLSDDKSNAYFIDGIQDEILTRLAKVADLKVISRTSTKQFQNKPGNLAQIARQLGVAHILEGSAQRSNDQVRVNVQLIKAASDAHLWADTFDRKITDVFTVESEIATKIADVLKAKLTGEEHVAMTSRPTENMEAHEFYLKGRYFAGKRTGDDLMRAIDYYNEAISRDPNYALAYAALAESYGLLPEYSKEPTDECFAKGKIAANKALAIDSSLAEAQTAMAFMATGDFDFKEARKGFVRAMELNPNSAPAHYFLGISVLAPLGEFDQAIAEIKRAVELDPLSIIMSANLGYCYYLARRYPEAMAQLRNTVELDPNFAMAHGVLGLTLQATADLDGAITEFEKASEIGHRRDFPPLVFLARAYALRGDRAKAMQIVDEIRKIEQPSKPFAYGNAIIHLTFGDRSKALDSLEESYRNKETGAIVYIRVDPVLDPLHGNPRFEALANKIVPPPARR